VDISIELSDDSGGYIEATCPQLGLVTRASSLDEVLKRISRLVLYVTSSLEAMPLDLGERPEGIERLSARFADKNFWMPRYPKVH
jgi:hypothetical protein